MHELGRKLSRSYLPSIQADRSGAYASHFRALVSDLQKTNADETHSFTLPHSSLKANKCRIKKSQYNLSF